MTVVVGIIGPPCSGKSTVARRLCVPMGESDARALAWIDADRIAKSMLLEPEIKTRLIDLFGDGILDHQGNVERSEIAQRVFGESEVSKQALEQLTRLVHPPTHARIWQQLRAAQQSQLTHVVLDVPLLIESQWHLVCDEVWYLEVPSQQQQMLLQRRGWSQEEWQRRLQRQAPLEEKRRYATRVLNNAGDESFLENQVDHFMRGWEVCPPAPDHCLGAGTSI
ncbi:MAG: dephospho-CoA kinase [Planctomycetota bacterium]